MLCVRISGVLSCLLAMSRDPFLAQKTSVVLDLVLCIGFVY